MITLEIIDFDFILGMDWLSLYHTILDCYAKIVTLAMLGRLGIKWKGSNGSSPNKVISFIQGQKLFDKGCLSYLVFIWDTSVDPPPIKLFPAIQKCVDYSLLIFWVSFLIEMWILLLI